MKGQILLSYFSGYNIKLSEKDYWSIDPEKITRNRFFEFKSFPHAPDNYPLSDSRMDKVESLYNLLNQKPQAYEIFDEDLSIDQSMVPLSWVSFLQTIHSCQTS